MSESILPEGWVSTTFEMLIKSMSNGIGGAQNKENKGIPVSRIETIANERFDFTRIGYIESYDEEKAKKYRINKNEILFSHINSPVHLGKTAIFNSDSPLYHGINLLRIIVDEKTVNPYYFNYFCKYSRTLGNFSLIAQHAVNQSSLNQTKLKAFQIDIPPLNEQTRIANKLDELLAQVDTIKARVDAIPSILKRFRQSVLAAAVSGKLTESWRKESNYTETLLDIDLPVNWNLKEIQDFAEVKGGKRLPKGEELVNEDTGFPYIRAGQLKLGTVISGDSARNCQKYLLPHVQEQIKRYIVDEGDVYITIVGASIGDAGVIPIELNKANLTENAAKICEFSDSVKGVFIALWLRSSFIQQLIQSEIKSGAQGKLALKRIRSLPFPEVELEEQAQIVQRVEQLFTFADQIEQRVNDAQARINNLTQSILAKAFRGELVPQDPSDEPAIELLARIQQEREAAAALAKAAKKATKAPAKRRKKAPETAKA